MMGLGYSGDELLRLGPLWIVSGVFVFGSLLGAAYWLLAAREIGHFQRRAEPFVTTRPPVTLLKPLSGEEVSLYDNLRSFCESGYGPVQVVFGVGDSADPAARLVARLQADLPDRDIELVADARVHGKNLKISNLINMMGAARHDLLVIADSDIRVGPGYLETVIAPLQDPEVGLVTCLYVGRPERGLWSRLGAMWVNHGFLPSVLVAERFGLQRGAFGATLALRRDTLDKVGGLLPLRDILADDYALGEAVRKAGQRVVLSGHTVEMVVAEPRGSALVAHELRWLRTIRSIEPWGYAGMVVTHPVPLAVAALLLTGFSPFAWGVFAVSLVCRWVLVSRVDHAFRLEPTGLWAVLLRDLLSFGLFLAGLVGSRVDWRGRHFRIQPDGSLVHDGGSQS